MPLAGFAQTNKVEIHKATPSTLVDDKGAKPKDSLLADKLEIKKKISSIRQLRDAELKRELERESLESPSEELYGEHSWTSQVNPFTSGGGDIPDEYDINLEGFVMPLDQARVTSHYGYRARFGRNHYGTDMGLSIGDTVRSAFDGKVRIAAYEGRGYGNYVVVRHPNGLETVYGHLDRRMVTEGTIVRAGDPIGLGGNTGRSTGPHLHFEARFMGIPLDPEVLFDFELGAPLLDSYTFRKGSSHTEGNRNAVARQKSTAPNKKLQAPQVYHIKSGDTLSKIAKKYNIPLSRLRSMNHVSERNLKIGSVIRLS